MSLPPLTTDSNKPPKTKHSDFLITINTNYRPKLTPDSKDVGKVLSKAINKLNTHENLTKIITLDGTDTYAASIKKIKAQFAVEIGQNPKGRRIHAHLILQVDHTSRIQINIPVLREVVDGLLDDPRIKKPVYVNVKYTPSGRSVEDYIKKTATVNVEVK